MMNILLDSCGWLLTARGPIYIAQLQSKPARCNRSCFQRSSAARLSTARWHPPTAAVCPSSPRLWRIASARRLSGASRASPSGPAWLGGDDCVLSLARWRCGAIRAPTASPPSPLHCPERMTQDAPPAHATPWGPESSSVGSSSSPGKLLVAAAPIGEPTSENTSEDPPSGPTFLTMVLLLLLVPGP
jgi:hypothetical protein